MKVILINGRHGGSRSIELGRVSRAMLSLCCLGLPLGMGAIGYLAGQGSDARALVADGALLLDVRSEGEYTDGGIEGSLNIPIQELSGRMEELGDKDDTIIVYCQSGGRSAMAKRLLEANGFTSVHDMGGIGQW